MNLDTRQYWNCTLIGRNPHDTQRASVQSNSGEIIEDESLWIEYASTFSPLLPQGLGNGDRDESQRTNYVPKSNPHALYKCVHIRPTQLLLIRFWSIPSKFPNEYWDIRFLVGLVGMAQRKQGYYLFFCVNAGYRSFPHIEGSVKNRSIGSL